MFWVLGQMNISTLVCIVCNALMCWPLWLYLLGLTVTASVLTQFHETSQSCIQNTDVKMTNKWLNKAAGHIWIPWQWRGKVLFGVTLLEWLPLKNSGGVISSRFKGPSLPGWISLWWLSHDFYTMFCANDIIWSGDGSLCRWNHLWVSQPLHIWAAGSLEKQPRWHHSEGCREESLCFSRSVVKEMCKNIRWRWAGKCEGCSWLVVGFVWKKMDERDGMQGENSLQDHFITGSFLIISSAFLSAFFF